MRFAEPVCNISNTPSPASTTVSQGLYGEHVEILGRADDSCHIRNWRDDYEGCVPCSSLEAVDETSTHYISTAASLLFRSPDIKSAQPLRVLYGSELVVRHQFNDRFLLTDNGLYALAEHCLPMGTSLTQDLVAIAEERFLGIPYLWGGRTPDGFDCSGLVQMAAFSAGVLLPRDSNQQESFINRDIERQNCQRSDFVFWPGHVGLLVDEYNLLHATAHSMLSQVEPLDQVLERAGEISSIKRL